MAKSEAAVYAACGPCAAEWMMTGATEYAPGRFMATGHASHAAELVAIGWVQTYPDGPDEPADVVCPHYEALCAGD